MKSVILLGGGYSVLEGIEKGLWDKIKSANVELWSLNFAFYFLLEQNIIPSRQIWVDSYLFSKHRNSLEQLHKQHNVPLFAKEHPQYNLLPITQYKAFKSPSQEEKYKDGLFSGQLGFVGIFALSLACKEEFDTVYLLGYDFGTPSINDDKTHWYQDQAEKYNISSSGIKRPQVYRDRANDSVSSSLVDFCYFDRFKNTKIINVGLRSNITVFERIGYDQFFERLCG